jgi:hypothetical protein
MNNTRAGSKKKLKNCVLSNPEFAIRNSELTKLGLTLNIPL